MLIRFSIGNFRSFNGEETLQLTPTGSRIHQDHVLEPEVHGPRIKALPLAVLYGANASGKSNLIRAMDFARSLIIQGTRPDIQTGTIPFRLDPQAANSPSRFEFVFSHDKVLYTYGFTVTSMEICEEWLFAVMQRKESRLFERKTVAGKSQMEFGKHLATSVGEKKRLQFIAAGTRRNQLFLTEANDRNVEILAPLIHWFRDHLAILWPGAEYRPLLLRAHDDTQFTEFLARFLTLADTGIEGIKLEAETLKEDGSFPGLPAFMKIDLSSIPAGKSKKHIIFSAKEGANKIFLALLYSDGKSAQILTLRTKHQNSEGETVLFDVDDESDGTYRLMHLAPALLGLQSNEDIYVIDELDRSLHPHVARMFLDTFLRGVSAHSQRGQMILTTHDTNLLDLDLLRRDEIWFVEKDRKNASHIISLADYNFVRADLRIDRGYLKGRFGAVPYLGDVEKLFSDKEQE